MKGKRNNSIQKEDSEEVILKGVSICPGIGIGRVHLVDPVTSIKSSKLPAQKIKTEKQRYMTAVDTAKRDLQKHLKMVHGRQTPEVKTILDIHKTMLNDNTFHNKVKKCIASEQKNAEWCLWNVAADIFSRFNAMRDPYFQARGEDIRDMAQNLIQILSKGKNKTDGAVQNSMIFASRYLHSSDAMLAHRKQSVGFISESRALVSHAAILLKGYGIAAVGGVPGLIDHVEKKEQLIVDGNNGWVIVHPSEASLKKYRRIQRQMAVSTGKTDIINCVAADGTQIRLKANIENPEQVELMFAYGLDGIGLFRTEFLISSDGRIPTEEEQYETYRSIIKKAQGRFVVIRTFDIGGDKTMGLLTRCTGRNPALGLRGIRRHLTENTSEFRAQLRAILRAADNAEVGILIPMVSTVEDIIEVKKHWEAVKTKLHENRLPFSTQVVLGSMIEIPAAAAAVKEILSHVAFISLGANDLLQYFMAADRDNESVIHYLDASSSSFLWLMRHIIEQAKEVGREKDVTVCGEVASDPGVFPHLIKMGFRSFSVPPVAAASFRNTCGNLHLNNHDIEKLSS